MLPLQMSVSVSTIAKLSATHSTLFKTVFATVNLSLMPASFGQAAEGLAANEAFGLPSGHLVNGDLHQLVLVLSAVIHPKAAGWKTICQL